MKPQPLSVDSEYRERCTCDEIEWEAHMCSFKEEIAESKALCTCCPYCEGTCRDEV